MNAYEMRATPGRVRLVLLAAAFLLVGGLPLAPLAAAPAGLTPLSVSSSPFVVEAPIFIALEEGFFAAEGLDVRLAFFRDSAQILPALIAGQLDVYAGGNAAGIYQAILQGAKVKIVADRGHAAPGDSSITFMVRKELIDSGRFRTLKDLRGMRIGLHFRGGLPDMFLGQILRNRALLTEDDVQIQQLPVPLLPDAMRAKAVDAAPVAEPFVTLLEGLGLAKTVVTLDEAIPRAQYGVVAYGPNLLTRNPGLGQRFMNAYLRGVQAYQAGKTDRNVAIIKKYTNMDEALLRKMPWPLFNADGHVNLESVLQIQAWWVRGRWLERMTTPEQFLEAAFARRAFVKIRAGR